MTIDRDSYSFGLFYQLNETPLPQLLEQLGLESIKGIDMRRIAIPALLLRRLDPEAVRMILAEPCGMGNITTEHAAFICEGLRSETAFVEEVEGGIAFRQDLRIALYDSIAKNKEYNHIAIHDSAKDYYKFDLDLHFQAEHLFHRLKRGDDPTVIEIFYSDSLRPLLDTCLPELNPDAAASLASFMKITLPEEVVEKAGMFAWERYYTWLAKDALARDDEEALRDIYEKLLKRFDRSAQSPLFFYEAAVYLRFGELEKAAYVNLYGLQALPPYGSALPRLVKFSLQEIRIREKKEDFEGACAIGRSLRQELDTFNFAPQNEEQMKDLVDYIVAFMRVQKRVNYKTNLNREIKRLADLLVGHKGSPSSAILKYYQALPEPEPVRASGLKLMLKSLRGYLSRKRVL
ncbi:hypothetical protein ACX0G9_27515 [Flavitalea flava]